MSLFVSIRSFIFSVAVTADVQRVAEIRSSNSAENAADQETDINLFGIHRSLGVLSRRTRLISGSRDTRSLALIIDRIDREDDRSDGSNSRARRREADGPAALTFREMLTLPPSYSFHCYASLISLTY